MNEQNKINESKWWAKFVMQYQAPIQTLNGIVYCCISENTYSLTFF